MMGDDDSQKSVRLGVGLATAAALGGVVFGDFAQDVSQWLVCAHADYVAEPCKGTPKTQALAIGTFVSTMVAIWATSSAAVAAKKSKSEAVSAVAASLLGCLFALLKTSVGSKGYPDIEPLRTALLIYLAILAIFVVPIYRSIACNQSLLETVQPLARWSGTLLLAFCLGSLLQGASELLWQGKTDRFSSRKFVLPPMGALPATAIFAVLVLRTVTSKRKHSKWLAGGLCAGAIALAALYGILEYFPDHGGKVGWMRKANLAYWHAAFVFVGLTLPIILAYLTYGLAFGRDFIPTKASLMTTPAVVIVAATAFWIGQARIQSSMQTQDDQLVFVLTHGMVPVLVTLVVWATSRLTKGSEISKSTRGS